MNQLFFSKSVRWIISYITVLIIFLFCTAYYLYEPPVEIVEETEPLVFAYPLSDPTFLQYEDVILSYEYVANGKHLVAVKNGDDEYIMPLFDDRETALDFMNQYFVYLRGIE